MQKRSREQERNIRHFKHNLEVMKFQEKTRQGDLWYTTIKFINAFKNGEFITAFDVRTRFTRKSESDVWVYIHTIRYAGYLEMIKGTDWYNHTPAKFKKLYDVPYHISKEKFEKNRNGEMLWIESEVLFKKE